MKNLMSKYEFLQLWQQIKKLWKQNENKMTKYCAQLAVRLRGIYWDHVILE